MALSPQENGGGAPVAPMPVLVKDQYLIGVDEPLHDLDTPSAKAFAVRDRNDQDAHLFALICTPGLPTRVSEMRRLRGDSMPGILPLVEWDTVFWPPIGQETMIVIYRRPLGGSVADAIDAGRFKVNEYEIQGTFLEPIFATLRILNDRNIAHREIRVGNLYFMDEDFRTRYGYRRGRPLLARSHNYRVASRTQENRENQNRRPDLRQD